MELNRIQKLAKNKIDADLYTNKVRQEIRQNARKRQDRQEAFKDEFDILLKSQESSVNTQKDILKELQKLNREGVQFEPNNQREQQQDEDESSDEEDEQSSDDERGGRPHMRIPEFLYRIVTGTNPSRVTSAIRNALIGTAGIATGIAVSNYLGEQLSDKIGEQINETLEPTVDALKDNLREITTKTANAIYEQAATEPKESTALTVYNPYERMQTPQNPVGGLSNLIYNGIIGAAGANAAAATYRLITESLPFRQVSRLIRKLRPGGIASPQNPAAQITADEIMTQPPAQITADEIMTPPSKITADEIMAPPSKITADEIMAAHPVPDLVKPSKNPVNLFDLPQNQPIIPDTFAPGKIASSPQIRANLLPPRPNSSFPPVDKLIEKDLEDLVEMYSNLNQLFYYTDRQIKKLEKKPTKTKLDLFLLNNLKKDRQSLVYYQDYLSTFYIMKNELNYRGKIATPQNPPAGFPANINTLDKKELGDLAVKAIATKNSIKDPALIKQIDNYILHLFSIYKEKTGRGHKASELFEKLNKTTNIQEYILLLHKLRDMGIISNTQLNKMLAPLLALPR